MMFISCCSHQVTNRQFLASEAWSTSGNLLQNLVTSQVASGVLGVAIRSSPIPGFANYLRSLHPIHHPDDEFLKEFWENEFGCTPWFSSHFSSSLKSSHLLNIPSTHVSRSLWKASLPPCSGTESLEGVQHPFTDTSQLRVAYNVYLAVYAAAHALHSLLSCPNRDSPPGNNSSTCSSPKHIKPREVNMLNILRREIYSSTPNDFKALSNLHENHTPCVIVCQYFWWFQLLQHLNKVNVTTPQGEMFYFQGADIPAKYDLVSWQKTPEGSLKLVLIGRVDGFDLHLNESAIQWSTGSNQVVTSTNCVNLLKLISLSTHKIIELWILIRFMFRFLFQCAVRAAPQGPEWPTGKENLSAALTVFHVLKGRLAIQLVRFNNEKHQTVKYHRFQNSVMLTLESACFKLIFLLFHFSSFPLYLLLSLRFSSLWALSIWVLVQCWTNSLCPSSAGLSFL